MIIQTDQRILARRPELIIINKKRELVEQRTLLFRLWPQSKIEKKWKDGLVPWPSKGIDKKLVHESDGYTNWRLCSWYSHQKFGKSTRGLGNKRSSGDNPNYSIIEIG